MKVITAPNKLSFDNRSVFLAGSIEQDKAENWQDKVITELKDFDVTVLNPRRKKWNNKWDQSINNPEFKNQVDWELTALEQSDIIIMYFDPATKSPISMLELGLFANSGKMLVSCPEGFWRKGNIDIVCERYSVPMFSTLDKMVSEAKNILSNTYKT